MRIISRVLIGPFWTADELFPLYGSLFLIACVTAPLLWLSDRLGARDWVTSIIIILAGAGWIGIGVRLAIRRVRNIREEETSGRARTSNMANQSACPHETLLEAWGRETIAIQTRRVSAQDIAAFENRYSVVLPRSFREYLTNASPVNDPSWDDDLTNWWPFEKLQSVSEGYEHEVSAAIAPYDEKLILFADYSIWCWAWAINWAPGADHGKVAVIGGRDRFVADSFDDFVDKYLADQGSVFP
jgi:hypothetical protein